MRQRLISMLACLLLTLLMGPYAVLGQETLTPQKSVERGAAPDGLPREPRWSNDGRALAFFAPAKSSLQDRFLDHHIVRVHLDPGFARKVGSHKHIPMVGWRGFESDGGFVSCMETDP